MYSKFCNILNEKKIEVRVIYEGLEEILSIEDFAKLLKPYLDSIENSEVWEMTYLGEKFSSEIKAKIKNESKLYNIWFISKHYSRGNDKKEKKEHIIEISEDWINKISLDIFEGKNKKEKTFNLKVIENNMFNPHFRLNEEKYPHIWFPLDNVEYISYDIYDCSKGLFKWHKKIIAHNKVLLEG